MSDKKIMQRKYDAPQYAMRTARRLFGQLKDQRFRLIGRGRFHTYIYNA